MNRCKPLGGGGDRARQRSGRAVQVDPIKPKLKPPRTERLKLMCDVLLSTFAFKFNLRRCNMVLRLSYTYKHAGRAMLAGAYTRSLFRST